jgi:hypothetical protein
MAHAAHLVEVDVHPLELEIRGSVVDTGAIETVLAGDVLPVHKRSVAVRAGRAFAGCTHQKAAPIWLPCFSSEASQCVGQELTYALAGLEMDLFAETHVSKEPRRVVLAPRADAGHRGRATANLPGGGYVQSHACWVV